MPRPKRYPRQPVRYTPWLPALDFFGLLVWLDRRPLLEHVEPYRRAIFTAVLDSRDPLTGRVRYNLALCGRAKKNWKSADLVLAALFALLANDSPGGNECLLVASDEGQADDDLDLAKKLVEVNPILAERLRVLDRVIRRTDGKGRLRILPGRDVAGEHGKTYRFLGVDEIHTQRDWDLLEALALDPTRADAQQWVTSYASIHHRPGVPLFDLLAQGRAGADPRMFFCWYAADYTTDPAAQALTPEERANPSRGTWRDPDYLAQQARRLPAHKFRRLHLNLPGLPEGSAFQAEPVMEAVVRGVPHRPPEPGVTYVGFVDMSGGSRDDACCGVAHVAADGRLVLDRLVNQGPPPPFDPRAAVARFAAVLAEYRVHHVMGDRYAGLTFQHDFARHGITYQPCEASTSELYEALQPVLNAHEATLLNQPLLEQQLLGLVWKGGKVTHPAGEHDDWATAAAGALLWARESAAGADLAALEEIGEEEAYGLAKVEAHWGHDPRRWLPGFVPDDHVTDGEAAW